MDKIGRLFRVAGMSALCAGFVASVTGCEPLAQLDALERRDSRLPSARLAFALQPSGRGVAGEALELQPIVTIQELPNANSGLDLSTAPVTLMAFTDEQCTRPAKGTLSAQLNPILASGGVAGFAGVAYAKAEKIHLQASSPGLLSVCSDAIRLSAPELADDGEAAPSQPDQDPGQGDGGEILPAPGSTPAPAPDASASPAPTRRPAPTATPVDPSRGPVALRFVRQPSPSAVVGVALASSPAVSVVDAQGRTVVMGGGEVTLAAFLDDQCSVPAAGKLTAPRNPLPLLGSSAVVFPAVSYDRAEKIHLRAASPNLVSACSNGIVVAERVIGPIVTPSPTAAPTQAPVPERPISLVFRVQPPARVLAGAVMRPAPVVEILGSDVAIRPAPAFLTRAYRDARCTQLAGGTLKAESQLNGRNRATLVAEYQPASGVASEVIHLGTQVIDPLALIRSPAASACSTPVTVVSGPATPVPLPGPTQAPLAFSVPPRTVSGRLMQPTPVVVRVPDRGERVVLPVRFSVHKDADCRGAAGGTLVQIGQGLAAEVTYTLPPGSSDGVIHLGATADNGRSLCSAPIRVTSSGVPAPTAVPIPAPSSEPAPN